MVAMGQEELQEKGALGVGSEREGGGDRKAVCCRKVGGVLSSAFFLHLVR